MVNARIRFILFVILAGIVPAVHASVGEGWTALLANQLPEANAQFEAAAESDPERALQGLFVTAWAEGNSPRMAALLGELLTTYPNSDLLPAYVAFTGDANLHGWDPQEKIAVYQKALEVCSRPYLRQTLAVDLVGMQDMRLDPVAEHTARDAGMLVDHWAVAGPFGRTGWSDFFDPHGPEIQFQATYAGWQTEVKWIPVSTDRTGVIEFDSLLYPVTGVAYAVNVISSPTEAEALLSVVVPGDARVWWNGRPVMQKAGMFLDTNKTISTPVKVEAGENLLLIKAPRSGSWMVRAMVQARGEEAVPFQSVAFEPEKFKNLYIQPFETVFTRGEDENSLTSDYPLVLEEAETEAGQIFQRLMMAEWHQERAEFTASRAILAELMEEYPSFALPYILYGDVSLRLASLRRGSKARFQREAEQAFQKALELNPLSRGALIGMQLYYLDREQVDQALDGFDAHLKAHPQLLEEGYTNLLHYSHGLLYSKKGFQAEALQKFQLAREGFIPSINLYGHLFDRYLQAQDSDAAYAVAKEALDAFPAWQPFLKMAIRLPVEKGNALGLEEKLKQAIALHPYSVPYINLLCELYINRGEVKKARELIQALGEPIRSYPPMVEKEAQLAMLDSDRAGALRLAQALYAEHPIRPQSFRILRDVAERADFAYMKYDTRLTDIDVAKAARWENSRASVIFLLDIMVLELHEDGTSDTYVHQAIQILNQEGIDKWSEIVIPKGVEIIQARTITPDGTEWAVSHVQDLNNQQSLSMYGLEPGAIVEYAYLQRGGSNDPGSNYNYGGYYFGSDDDPMLLSKLTIVRPKSIPFQVDANPDDFAPVSVTEEGDVEIYVWQKEMQDGLKPEPFAPPLSERVESIEWSTARDWQPFVERFRAGLWGYEEQSAEMTALAEELKAKAATPLGYIQAVYEWIRTTIEDAAGGETTADTMALKSGGIYQKMRLARALLKANGIQTRLALAFDNKPEKGYRPLPQLGYPGGTVLYAPRQEGIEERIILDFSSRFAPFGQIAPDIRKKVVLVLDEPAPYLEPLEPKLWEHGLLRRDIDFVLNRDRSAELSGRYIYDDLYDRQVRELLTNPEVKKRLADSQLAQDFAGIEVASYSFEDMDDLTLAPKMQFAGMIPDMVKPKGDLNAYKITPIFVRSNTSALITDVTRESALVFESSPMRDLTQLSIDFSAYLEQGASVQVPENLFMITRYGYYALFYEWNGKRLEISRSILIPDQRVEPSDYAGFVDFCRKVEQAEDREISVVLPARE